MNGLDWIALGIFVLTVVFNVGMRYGMLKDIRDLVLDHEDRIRTLEGRPGRSKQAPLLRAR